MSLNRYERAHAAEKIADYFIPRPNETAENAFARAKGEYISSINNALRCASELTYDQYKAERRFNPVAEGWAQ